MSRRAKIITLIIAGIAVIIGLIWFLMKPQITTIRQTLNINTATLPQAGVNINARININAAVPVQEKPPADISIALKSLASSFAERYGSFSNQTNFKNLSDLSPLLTAEFDKKNSEYIKEQLSKQGSTADYFGVTSKAVQSKIININEEKTIAKVQVSLQRREAKGSMNSNVKIYYQNILVSLVKVGDEWKVGAAEWR